MNIILIGTGRMGRLLKECALDAGDAVVGEYGRANIAELAAAPAADVAIDFSGPEALPAVAAYVAEERGEKDADCAFVYGSVTPEGNLRLPGYAGQRAFVVTDRGLTYAIE